MKLGNIPDDHKRDWTVIVDGKRVEVSILELHSRFGDFYYGLRSEGFDGWVFHERGGGGSFTIPYAWTPEGELRVGLVLEERPNMSAQPVLCAIGGFIDSGETHDQAQIREAREETGLDAQRSTKLEGLPANSNRFFFVANPYAGEGMYVCIRIGAILLRTSGIG